ncbi:hypothetical protein AB0H73_15135 [Streptomyces olivoreticuli]
MSEPFCPRVADLLDAIRRQGGGWTTHRVVRTHRANGHRAPNRATARRDLDLLARAGYLVRDYSNPDRLRFLLNGRSIGGAQ